MSAREARLKNCNEHKDKSSESENAQESSESENAQESGSSTESTSSEDAQESQPSKRKCKCKKVQVIKTKEYKIPRCKKHTSYKKCSLCLKKIPHLKGPE